MAIYDKKEVFIYIEPTADLTESPALGRDPFAVGTVTDSFFETLWNTALELPKYSTDDNQV